MAEQQTNSQNPLTNYFSELVTEAVQKVLITALPKPGEKLVDAWLNTKEACLHLRCSRSKLNRLMKNGLKFQKLGRSTLFKRSDLDDFLKSYSLNQF